MRKTEEINQAILQATSDDFFIKLLQGMLKIDQRERQNLNELLLQLNVNVQQMEKQDFSAQQLILKIQELENALNKQQELNNTLIEEKNYYSHELIRLQNEYGINFTKFDLKNPFISKLNINIQSNINEQQKIENIDQQNIVFLFNDGTQKFAFYKPQSINNIIQKFSNEAITKKDEIRGLDIVVFNLIISEQLNKKIPRYHRSLQIKQNIFLFGGLIEHQIEIQLEQNNIFAFLNQQFQKDEASNKILFLNKPVYQILDEYDKNINNLELQFSCNMIKSRYSFGICSIENRFIFLIGGLSKNQTILKSCEIYDIETNQCTKISDLIHNSYNHCCFYNSKIKQIFKWGGRNDNHEIFAWQQAIESYDLKKDVWSSIELKIEQNLQKPLIPLSLSLVFQDNEENFIICGGTFPMKNEYNNSIYFNSDQVLELNIDQKEVKKPYLIADDMEFQKISLTYNCSIYEFSKNIKGILIQNEFQNIRLLLFNQERKAFLFACD